MSLIDKNGIDSRETNRRFKLMSDNPINITETGHKQEFVLSPGGEEFVEIVRLDEVNGEGKFDLLYAAEPKHRSIWVKQAYLPSFRWP